MGSNATAGTLGFKLKADAGELKAQLDAAGKQVKDWKNKTEQTLAKKPAGAASSGKVIGERLEIGKRGLEASRGSLDAVVGLARISPAAAGAAAALIGIGAAANGAREAFATWQQDMTKPVTGAVVVGSLLEEGKKGISDYLSEAGGALADFGANLIGVNERQRLETEREIALQNERAKAQTAENQKRREKAEAEKQAAIKWGNSLLGQAKLIGMGVRDRIGSLLADAEPQFDAEKVIGPLLANTAQLATFGSAEDLAAQDAERLRIEQQSLDQLRKIANGNAVKIVEF